jgi:hypothetical protein
MTAVQEDRPKAVLIPAFPITPFYKGESQHKYLPGDWKKQRCLRCVPAYVVLRGSWGFLLEAIHFSCSDDALVSSAGKQCGCKCQPWFYLRLVALQLFPVVRGGIGLIQRLAVLAAHSPP